MKYLGFLLTFLISIPLLADQATVSVWTSGSTSAAREMFKGNPNVRVLGRDEEMQRYKEAGVLEGEERDQLFKDAGVWKKVDEPQMDEMDKDMFIMAIHQYKFEDLVKKYPQFSERELKDLKSRVEKAL